MPRSISPPLLIDALPAFAKEVEDLLIEHGEAGLAAQVASLRIADRCRCGEDFCAAFYTQPKPKGSYGPSHRNVALEPQSGMIILDVVDERIMQIEVLDREDVRQILHAIT